MYPVTEFQAGIPEDIEDLFDQLFDIVSGNLPVNDHQVNIGVDTKLLASVASKCDQTDRYGIFHRQVVSKHRPQGNLIDKLEDRIDLFGMLDKKIFPPCMGKGLLKCLKIAFDLFFQQFCNLDIGCIFIQQGFNLTF